jgi:thiamine pyrophosphokinase
MRTVIFAGGDYKEHDFYRSTIHFFDLKIAADSGANFLKFINVVPDILIGDMDSIDEDTLHFCAENGSKIIRFPSQKDEIDTELAMIEASKIGSETIFIAGAFGTRLDQTLGVFRLMERFRNSIIFNEDVCSFIIDHPLELESIIGETWSIIPLQKDANDVSLKGFKYDLIHRKMEYLRPYGISNESSENNVFIDPGDGKLLVFRYHSRSFGWIDELSFKLK